MLESFIVPLLAATVQSGTPILYATLGEILTEKGGVLNLGVEGMMSMAAFAAFFVTMTTGNPWLGFIAGGIAGTFMAALHGFVCITCLGNQVVSGLALTILGVGLCNFLGTPYIGTATDGFDKFSFPVLSAIPYIGDIFFKQDALVYVSYLIPVLFMLFINRTSLGLAISAVGEKPAAAAAVGLKAIRLRWIALLGGGFFIGLGGLTFPSLTPTSGPTAFPVDEAGSRLHWLFSLSGDRAALFSVLTFSVESWPSSSVYRLLEPIFRPPCC